MGGERMARRQQRPAQPCGGRLPHLQTRCCIPIVPLAGGPQAASLKLPSANGRLLGRRDGPSGQLGVSGAGMPGTVP